jgi:hypothetical protein
MPVICLQKNEQFFSLTFCSGREIFVTERGKENENFSMTSFPETCNKTGDVRH